MQNNINGSRAISLHLDKMTQSEFRAMYMEIRDPIAHALIYALEHSQGEILHVGLHALENLLKVCYYKCMCILYLL